jgi:hypothetical protein
MIKKLVAVTASFLTACTSVPSTEPVFYSKTKTIKWRRVADVDAYCRTLLPELPPGQVYRGCSNWSRVNDTCTIITGLVDNHEIIGHELKHCFVGEFHK